MIKDLRKNNTALVVGNKQNKTEISNQENEPDKTSIDSKFEAFSSNLLMKVTEIVDAKPNSLILNQTNNVDP